MVRQKPARVLFVEEDDLIYERVMLEQNGYKVTWVQNEEDALGFLDNPPDILIADRRLDEKFGGMGGDRVMYEFRKRYPTLYILCTTGARDKPVSATSALFKPYEAERLVEILDGIIL